MKSKNYQIHVNGELLATKHAWNSSCRFIEQHVGSVARQEQSEYNLVECTGEKDVQGFYKGVRLWVGNNGNKLHYTINLVK